VKAHFKEREAFENSIISEDSLLKTILKSIKTGAA